MMAPDISARPCTTLMAELFLVVVLALLLVVPTKAEPYDINMIYRFHEAPPLRERIHNSDVATLEYRGLPLLLTNTNGTFVDPSEGMPMLGCANIAQECSWQKKGWRADFSGNEDSVVEHVTVSWSGAMSRKMNLHSAELHQSSRFPQSSSRPGAVRSCSVDNGGCVHDCSMSGGVAHCSCPSGYSLLPDQRGCKGHYYYLYYYGTAGGFNFSKDKDQLHSNDRRWMIVTPPGTTIRLTFWKLHSFQSSNRLTIYDGDKTSDRQLVNYYSNNFPNTFPLTVSSSSNKMFILGYIYSHYNSYTSLDIEATFEVGYPVLKLSEDKGTLTSMPVLPTSNALCMSIVYKLASYATGRITASAALPGGQELNLPLNRFTEIGDWRVGTFRQELSREYTGQPVTLSVSVHGKNSELLSIIGCDPNRAEDVLVLSDSVSGNDIPTPRSQAKGSGTKCRNAGVWDSSDQKCRCPAGFMGDTCEEGCGPNRYGWDCSRVCSYFGRGCERMIFCRPGLECTCAPGLKGRHCDIECSPGSYGDGCLSRCGQCQAGHCDPYTGRCAGACSPGFYPPLCQEKLKMISNPPMSTNVDYNWATISVDASNTTGRGSVEFYQLQYKEKTSSTWKELVPKRLSSNTVVSNITGLRSGVDYQARVVLIGEDGYSNQKSDVPMVDIKTLCKVPDSSEYHAESSNITSTSFDVSWQYHPLSSTWCPITGYKVSIEVHQQQHLHHEQNPRETTASYLDLIPGRSYGVRIRALTELGKASFSHTLTVRTVDQAPGEVVQLSVARGDVGELKVSWKPPRITGGTIKHYLLEYQCVRLLACTEGCRNSSGQRNVSSTSSVISGLRPHAQYSIKVAGVAEEVGPFQTMYLSTENTAPTIAPEGSPKPILKVSNISLTVQWQPPFSCSGLNGFFEGYRYQLVTLVPESVVETGTTENTKVFFSNLTPLTAYQVQVYVVTSGEWSTGHKLVINATTSPTVPDGVQNLTVYKKGRRMIGVRWAPPFQSYGTLKSFTISHRLAKDIEGAKVRETIEPVHCGAWPELYCHTINRLVPDSEYIVSVQARNTQVDTDGTPVVLQTETREGAPGAPRGLRVFNRTQSSVVIEWGMPNMINGVLRSFLVNVEETDTANSSDCCEYFPLQELPVRTEDPLYRLEVTGLRPASALTVSISAKTVTIGPSANTTANTRPEPPVLLQVPKVKLPRESKDGPFSVTLHPSVEYPGLDSTYLLLVLPPGDAPEVAIWDEDLSEQLRSAVGQVFYMVDEYQPLFFGGLSQEVSFGTGTAAHNSTLGHLQDPTLTLGEVYSVGLALVLDYRGTKSVTFLSSEPFLAQ